MLRQTASMTTALALALAGGTAFAGSADAPEPEPVIEAPAAPVSLGTPDWTGFYVGGEIGWADVDTNVSDGDDDIIGGIVGGYDYDLGDWVIGAGLDYDFADIDAAPGVSLEDVFRAKVRGGRKIGNGLLYATGGYAWADTDTLGDDDGYFIGGGYEHRINDRFSLGGEVLYHEFDDFNGGPDVEATTVQLRGTLRF